VSRNEEEPLSVLVMIKGLGIGGAEKLLAESAPLWAESLNTYHVAYMLPWKDQLTETIEACGIEVTCIEWRGPGSLGAIARFRDHVHEMRPTLIHSHLPAAGIFARMAQPGIPHFYTEHNVVGFYRQPTRTMNRLTYGRNAGVIAVSEAVADSLVGYPGPAPRVIPNGVSDYIPERTRSEIEHELGIGADTKLVVHVGNIRPHKGHNTLIEAVRRLGSDVPILVVSVGAEKRAGDLARLQRRVTDLGIQDRIRFLGRRSDARDLIAAADLIVNPADVEGLPVFLLEALMAERPVVATAVGGVPTLIEHEKTGLLVDPHDPEDLAAAILRALTSPSAEDWARNGSKRVRSTHGIAEMVESYESLYREVLDE
jgi:L-malate glycosyltransferase